MFGLKDCLGCQRLAKQNCALIAVMDPENPATDVERLGPYARICSILEHECLIYVLRVVLNVRVVLNAAVLCIFIICGTFSMSTSCK